MRKKYERKKNGEKRKDDWEWLGRKAEGRKKVEGQWEQHREEYSHEKERKEKEWRTEHDEQIRETKITDWMMARKEEKREEEWKRVTNVRSKNSCNFFLLHFCLLHNSVQTFSPPSSLPRLPPALPSFPLCHPLIQLLHLSGSPLAVSTVPRLCRCLLHLPGFSRVLLIAAVRDVEEGFFFFFSSRPPTTPLSLPRNH